ncbi:sensor histidine kinase [Gottschalkia purinilytica]|uniref:sensor histidine kinase n=1 Tax=Gottschalkia purinilytica TaxID=1503 RepID=UPI003BEED8E8
MSQTDNIAELFNKENLDKLKYTEDDKNKVSLKLEKINLELEKMFKKELDENKRKEALIIHQAKLAAMGEMIGNIAHQWRQPLNSLGLIISNIEDSYMYNDLSNEYLHSSVQTSKKLISQMSNTIDDFRDFLKPKNKKEEFCLYECIVSVLELFEENLRFNNIKVIFENIVMENAFGYENQYSQAIFNIISNSIDALASTGRPDKKIVISIYLEDDKIVSEFTDNGGGIKEEIADRIFNPYFTTKKEKQGTGLGLYITKTIIENNMGGKVEWKNQEEGVSMKVSLPKDGGKKNL